MGTRPRAFIALVILVAMLVLIPAPGLAHSEDELSQYERDWTAQVTEEGLTLELLSEFVDMVKRHPWYWGIPAPAPEHNDSSSDPPAQVSNTSQGSSFNIGAGVEQWRSLVATYFPPDQVDRALCVMAHESGGNPNAKNPRSSASGLFQLVSTWHDYFGINPFDPVQNVSAAAKLLALYGWSQWSPYNRGLCR